MMNLTKEQKIAKLSEFKDICEKLYIEEQDQDDKEIFTEEHKALLAQFNSIKEDGIIEDILTEAHDVDTEFNFIYNEDLDYKEDLILKEFSQYEDYVIKDLIEVASRHEWLGQIAYDAQYDWLQEELDSLMGVDETNPIRTKGYMKEVSYAMNLDTNRREPSHSNYTTEEGGYGRYRVYLKHKLDLTTDMIEYIQYGLQHKCIADICDNLNVSDWIEYYEALPYLNEWCEKLEKWFTAIDITDQMIEAIQETIEKDNIHQSKYIPTEQVEIEVEQGKWDDLINNELPYQQIYLNDRSKWSHDIPVIEREIQRRRDILKESTTGDRTKWENETNDMEISLAKIKQQQEVYNSMSSLEKFSIITEQRNTDFARVIAYKIAEREYREQNRDNRIEEALDGMN